MVESLLPGDALAGFEAERSTALVSPRRVVRRVVLPKLLDHQRDIALDDHRFKVVDAGRRFGKTLLGLVAVLDGHGPLVNGVPKFRGALHGATIWWVAPSHPISKKIWRDLKRALRKWGPDLQKDETERRIEFPGGGSITIKSAHDPDSLVGDGLHGLVIDEAALCSADTWDIALRPTLADFEGWCLMISTPRGLNWFHDEYQLGQEGSTTYDPDYKSWQRPTSDNPTIKPAEIERMRRKMGEFAFQQECLARFEVRSGTIFTDEWFRLYSIEGDRLIPELGEPVYRSALKIFMSADCALTKETYSDHTAIFTWGLPPSLDRLFLLDIVHGKWSAAEIPPLMRKIQDDSGAVAVYVEVSGPIGALNKDCRQAGVRIVEIGIHGIVNGKKGWPKEDRAQKGAAATERGDVLVLGKRGPHGKKIVSAGVSNLIAECCAFPSKGVPDDRVDGYSWGVIAAERMGLKASGVTPRATRPERSRRREDDEGERSTGWLVGR